MNDKKDCPRCGKELPADAPEGVCPSCLAAAYMQTGTAPSRRGEALPVVEVARSFPDLEIVELIGTGGMGSVYKACQPKLDRLVALKILNRGEHDPRFVERFSREAKTLAKLSHPNIVAVYEFGERDGLFFLVMELVDGVTLRHLLRAGKMKPEQALAIVPPICEALQYAHGKGVIHRDIKPENILVDKDGRVKVADFGIARLAGLDREQNLTGEAEVVGTAHYMAPEQVERPASVDHRADIYALGVVFYEMLTGELPLGRFPNPSKKVQIDVRLDEVVLKALEKEPEQRYQQASEVQTRVETIAGAAGPSTVAPREIFWGNLSMVVLGAGILLTLVLWQVGSPRFVALGVLSATFLAAWVLSFLSWRIAGRNPAGAWQLPAAAPAASGLSDRIRGVLAHWWTRQLKALVWELPLTVVVMLTIFSFFLAHFQMQSDQASPEVPRGSFVIANRLSRHFSAGEFVAYREEDEKRIARVAMGGPVNGELQIERRNAPVESIPADRIIGKIIFNTRPEETDTTKDEFSPVVELVVESGIDFDTGKRRHLPLPQSSGDRDQARYDWFNSEESGLWMRQHGMDAVNGNHALMSKDLTLVKLEIKAWDTLSADKLRQKMLGQGVASDSFTDSSSRTFGFKTREGGIGIVQMLEDRYAPGSTTRLPGVKIRYKLLRDPLAQPGLKPKTQFAAQLPDGSFVELVSLMYGSNPRPASGQASEIDWFWNPDGTPSEENIGWSFGPGRLSSTRDASLEYRGIVARWGGPDANHVRLMGWQIDENRHGSADGQFPVTPKGESAENWIGLMQGFPSDKKSATIRFALASGPYTDGPKPDFLWSSSDITPYGSFSIGEIFDHNGNAAVTLTHNLKDCDYRLHIIIDTSPKPESAIRGLIWEWKQESRRDERYQAVYGRMVGGGAFNQTFEFPGVPAQEAMTRLPRIHFEVRPVRWLEFQNVALNAEEQTRVRIQIEGAGES
jgi:hypothetical protein